ncbi:MAG: hypothetical protein EAZ27_12415 [Cytophagales bacterium]|nr:MAG: hypothetical protein EAZ27_12415 [Cytophagales bacterium]
MRNLIIVSILLILSCCSSKKSNNPEELPTVKIEPVLINIFDNLIVPNFEDLSSTTTDLETAFDNFTNNPNQVNLDSVQNKYLKAYISYQYVSPFMFGPSLNGISDLSFLVNTFPSDTTQIKIRATDGNLNFADFKHDTRGFGALDYLLFHKNDTEIISELSNTNRKDYLKKVITEMKSSINTTKTNWINYRTIFVSDAKISAQSSINQLFNANVKSHELVKNYKLGIPLGLISRVSSVINPNQIEARYSGYSLKLLQESLKAVENTWLGKSKNNINGNGFDDLLNQKNETLKNNTLQQFSNIQNAYNQIPLNENMVNLINNDKSSLAGLFNQVTSNTRFIKSELASALSLSVTYSSNDGD